MLNLTVAMCLVWSLTILYGELFAFWVPSLFACSWPPPPSSSKNGAGYEAVKIAVLADPQLMDKTSHGFAPESLVLEVLQFYADLYMRRAFLSSIMPFDPDIILFLGDYFDGGPILSDKEWERSLSRFKHIFALNTRGRSKSSKVYHIPGNHDVGYASLLSHRREVVRRYEKEFGERNYRFVVGKLEFVAVDAQTIDGHSNGNLTSATWNFIKNVSADVRSYPKVLLSHIPLYRPDWTPCGPHRRSPIINQRVVRAAHDQEIAYQNYITKEASDNLLDSIGPILILSGHDHDQCSVVHMSKHGPATEHTVGTLSWQQGNLYPSFMLLTVNDIAFSNASTKGDAVSTHLCFLPSQTHIYLWYISLYVLTLLVGLLCPTNWNHLTKLTEYSRRIIKKSVSKKEKDEDEICEYEMLWDAEGSLHLVKKTSKAPVTSSNERHLQERSSAVSRSAAKKLISEVDASVALDIDGNVQSETTVKLLPRASKLKEKLVRRLMRTGKLLTIIAIVNVPLYMILLFKDWSEQ